MANDDTELNSKTVGFIGNTVLYTVNNTNNGDKELLWTATENCWCCARISAKTDTSYSVAIFVNGIVVARNANSGEIQICFPVLKGQEIRKTNGNATCIFYNML